MSLKQALSRKSVVKTGAQSEVFVKTAALSLKQALIRKSSLKQPLSRKSVVKTGAHSEIFVKTGALSEVFVKTAAQSEELLQQPLGRS